MGGNRGHELPFTPLEAQSVTQNST